MEQFEKLTFDDMLQEIGINKEAYITALNATVQVSFQLLHKTECGDNYNLQLLKDDPSNHDIQIIAGEKGAFTLTSYKSKYISKEEAGQINLLKWREEDSAKQGEGFDMKLKKLPKYLKI